MHEVTARWTPDFPFYRLAAIWITTVSVLLAPAAVGDVYINALASHNKADNAVDIEVNLGYISEGPAALVLFFPFDARLLAVPSTAGQDPSETQIAQPLRALGFVLTGAWHEAPGGHGLAVAVYHPGKALRIPPGTLFSFSMELLPAAAALDAISLEIPVAGSSTNALFASAAAVDGQPLIVHAAPFTAPLNCVVPAPPRRVRASGLFRSHIQVSWMPPAEDAGRILEYRVYRSTARDATQAVPLTADWVDTLSYDDRMPLAEIQEDQGCRGCRAFTRRYYWVRARDVATGCESDFSRRPARGGVLDGWFTQLSCRGG